jgi:elongation factor P
MGVRANNLKAGMIVEYKNDPCRIMSMTHITPGKGNAIVQTKLRNLRTGVQTENRYRATEDVNRVHIDEQVMQFLYEESETYNFMNNESYEQIGIHADDIGDDALFLTEGTDVKIQFYDGKIVGIELPKTVDLKVAECPPFIKGATATNKPKPATLETGLVLTVPNFIVPGEMIKVDTAEKKYLERVKK